MVSCSREVAMRWRWLASLGMVLLVAGLSRGGAPVSPCQAGYLVLPVDDPHGFHLDVVPYLPRPGDILLFDDEDPLHHFLLGLKNAGPPVHAAIAYAREDGTPGLLDLTGPTLQSAKVSLLDVMPRLVKYHGEIMVRRILQPMTPEQCAALRSFAQQQQGKEFAMGRMLLQGTPFCCRYGLRHLLFAGTTMDRTRWLCSELVVAGAITAHILDARRFPANCMYPRDLAFDERYDFSPYYCTPVLWVPDPHPLIHGNVVTTFHLQ
jgi:hypothetical protein